MSLLKIENISLKFPGAEGNALERINYQINEHDFVILLGSNGSGKSSLLKLIGREYQPNLGHIYFQDKLVSKYSNKQFSGLVSSLSQSATRSLFASLTVYENYILMKQFSVFSRIKHAEEKDFLRGYLKDYNPNLPNKLDTLVSSLSGGEQQALVLSLALMSPPKLLLLDEHTSALDPKTSDQIMALTDSLIKKHKITCVLTTHDLDIAMQYGNRILILHHGHIVKSIEADEKAGVCKESLATYY